MQLKRQQGEGKGLSIPYRQTLKSKDTLNEKCPGGVESEKRLLEKEGFKVRQKGKKESVEIHQNYTK